MIANLGRRKELVVYWFQAHDDSVDNTLNQKLRLFSKRLMSGMEDNAFIRITMEIGEGIMDNDLRQIELFIESFYPKYIKFVKGNRQ
jgi:hypothetical protein